MNLFRSLFNRKIKKTPTLPGDDVSFMEAIESKKVIAEIERKREEREQRRIERAKKKKEEFDQTYYLPELQATIDREPFFWPAWVKVGRLFGKEIKRELTPRMMTKAWERAKAKEKEVLKTVREEKRRQKEIEKEIRREERLKRKLAKEGFEKFHRERFKAFDLGLKFKSKKEKTLN